MVAYFFPGQSILMLLEGYGRQCGMQEGLQQLRVAQFFLVMLVIVSVGLISSFLGHRQVEDSSIIMRLVNNRC